MLLAKYILSGAFILIAIAGGVFYSQTEESALGAPTVAYTYDLLPVTDSLYKLGTSTRRFLSLHTDFASTTNLAIDGLLNKSCIGTDGSGNVIEGTCTGGGGSGNSKWATSTDTRYIEPNNAAGGFQATISTTTNATTTNLYVSGNATFGTPTTTEAITMNDGKRVAFYSDDLWTYAGGHQADRLRFYNLTDTAKSAITWYDATGTVPVAVGALVGHDLLAAGNEHKHISIETVDDSFDSLDTRFECTYGKAVGNDNSYCGVASGWHLKVGSGSDIKMVDGDFKHGSVLDIFPNADLGNTTIYARFATTTAGGLSIGGGGTTEIQIDDNATVTGNITSQGTTILLDSSGTATNAIDRGAVTNFASNVWRTAGTDQWTLGLRNDSTNNLHFRDNINSRTPLLLMQGANAGPILTGSSTVAGSLLITGNATATHATTTSLAVTNIASTSMLSINGLTWLNNNSLHLRGDTDGNHELRYDATTDGPLLKGFAGFTLNDTNGALFTGNGTELDAFKQLNLNTNDILNIRNATSAIMVASTRASTTEQIVSNLKNCNTIDTDANGLLSCGTDEQGGASEHNEWVNSAGPTSATSSNLIFGNSSSTVVGNLHITGNSTTTHATTTTIAVTTHATTSSLTVSGNTTLSQLTSALILTGATGLAAEYAGTSCTNQFIRSLDAVGAATCATVGTADVAGLDVSDDLNLAATWPVILTGDTLSLGFSTSTALANTQILYATAVNTFGSEAAFTYDPTLNRLTASQASFTTSTTTSATTTNFYSGVASSTSLWATNSVFASSTIGQSTTTRATSTYLFSDNASSTNLWASAVSFGQGIFTLANQTISTVASAIWNLGDAASLEIPNGTSKTLSAEGQYYHDTTSDNLIMSTSTANTGVVIGGGTTTLYALVVASSSPDMTSGGIIELPAHFLGQVATAVICDADAGTSVVINLSDGTNDTNTVTCTTTETQFAFTSNNEWTAMENIRIEFGTVTGSVDYIKLRFIGYRKTD